MTDEHDPNLLPNFLKGFVKYAEEKDPVGWSDFVRKVSDLDFLHGNLLGCPSGSENYSEEVKEKNECCRKSHS